MKTELDKQIIKALKAGVDVRKIAQAITVPERTFWRWLNIKPAYKKAYEDRKAEVEKELENLRKVIHR